MTREVLGHIDCPCCGHTKGMRITADKNGAPFGYCEANCNVQMRVGGDARRVAAFVERHPWAAGKKLEAQPTPAQVQVQEAKPVTGAKLEEKPVTGTVQKKRASVGPFDFLMKGKDDE